MSRRDRMRRTLIAYDVPDDRRRARLARVLEEYGDRIQYSVFVVDLLPSGLIEMKTRLRRVLDTTEGSVLMCDLGLCSTLTDEQFSFLGLSREITEQGSMIF